ncbi:MAG TPA: 5'-3' exonuclease [Candidatus Nanopelagicaceae bacterium]|nr:5'-3' exonuclease [Candidatus Nanopelagicaceae bacterium]
MTSLLLLDTASLWYRAYYGVPESVVSKEGQPVNAIRGVLDMTARLINQYRPDRIVACLDCDWRPSWRVALFPEYKANRLKNDATEEMPDTLAPQIPILLETLESFGIPMHGVDDYEADDIIATLTHTQKGPITIVTGDRDLFQLVDDVRDTTVAYIARGVSQHDLVNESWIERKYGIPKKSYSFYAMLRGDPSDGLPGVRGVGEKGAANLVNQFQSLDHLIAAAEDPESELSPSARKKVLASLEYLSIAPTVVNCAKDVPLAQVSLAIPTQPKDLTRLRELQNQYALGSSVERLLAAL